ncbi:amino acid ABC transporter substrate-binding protein [Weissella kandleri]|uniref:amino acid ABC transporter substrate-binding protein n=1 Tax=Weissella kandleri TaxID=1616 RepID=UPI00387E682B
MKWTKHQWLGNGLVLLVVVLLSLGIHWKSNHPKDHWQAMQQTKTVVVGIDDTFVPMGFRNQQGHLVGFDVDLARAAFKDMGLKVKFQVIDWSMKETELKTGHVDVIWNGYTATPDRAKQLAFSKPYAYNQQVILVLKDSPYQNVKALKGRSLGLQTGSSGMQVYNQEPAKLKQSIGQTIQYDTFDKALDDVAVNRIQGVLVDSNYAQYYLRHTPHADRFMILKPGYDKEAFVVGMRPEDHALKQALNQELAKLEKNGNINKLSKKYFGTPTP